MAFMIQSLEEEEEEKKPSLHNVLVLTLLYILHFF